jgi:hypothetical protein
VPSVTTSIIATIMATEPWNIRSSAPKIEASAGMKTAKRALARILFINKG